MRRIALLGLVAVFAASASLPAQARWGDHSVDTWVTYQGRRVGEETTGGTMSIQISRGQTISIAWFIRNLNGQPSWRHVQFEGCGWGDGFHIRYFARDGRDVTYKVTHEGFRSRMLEKGETASLVMRVTAVRRSSRACLLSAPATTRADAVHLNLRSV
jgi:hypothetical protein